MGTFDQILIYEQALKTNPKPNKGLIYTCNCGRIDAGHANGNFAKELWNKIYAEEGAVYSQQGITGFKYSRKDVNRGAGTITKNVSISTEAAYLVKSGLDTAQKEAVALAVFKDFSFKVETNQGSGLIGAGADVIGGSSFSEEDLVSNLVGFYDALKGTSWHNLCKPVSVESAKTIFERDGVGKIFQTLDKNTTYSPKFHSCDECTSSNFPSQYQSIPDISKGELFLDFNSDLAVSEEKYDLYFGIFRNSKNGLFLQKIPEKVRLVVKGNENQYEFGRRALMIAARQAGILSVPKQQEFATKFYPYTNNVKKESDFNLEWDGADLDKNGKILGTKEFNSVRGKFLIYGLSPGELDELRKIKFLLPF